MGPSTPIILHKRVLETVEGFMTEVDPNLAKAPQDVLRPNDFFLPTGLVDFSLTRQLPALLEMDPEAIFFTAVSAIPVADTIRGIYSALGKETPALGWIDTKVPPATPKAEHEIARIGKILDGRVSAVIIDEYVNRGATCERSRLLLKAAGATSLMPLMGRWYSDVNRRIAKIDFDRVSSRYADRMHIIGERVVATCHQTA